MLNLSMFDGYSFIRAKQINKGFSGDKKYRLDTEDGQRFLLRISDAKRHEKKEKCFHRIQRANEIGILTPKPVWFGSACNEHEVYTLLSWVDGKNAKSVLLSLEKSEQFKYGVEAGKMLRRFHDNCPADKKLDWQSRYFDVIGPRLDAYRREGIHFEGSEVILEYLERSKYLLKNRPQTHHHGDFHLDNMVISNDGCLNIIDWDIADFDNVGDPWYEFNRIGIEIPAFATGQINGYFNSNVPDEFWQLLAFYLAASAITSIVWAKYNAPEIVDRKIELNRQILRNFDGMNRTVPLWYGKTLYA